MDKKSIKITGAVNITNKYHKIIIFFVLLVAFFAVVSAEQVYSQNCGSGFIAGSDGSCVREVKFHSQVNLTLEQARNLAKQKNWELATIEQVKEAWLKAKLNVFAFGRTSSGDMCVPIQQPTNGFKKDPNCRDNRGNQGFFYVENIKKTATNSTTRSTALPAPISAGDTVKVMKWIALKVSAVRVPYCYKKSETRGAGKPLSNKCAPGLEKDAGLCYPKCKSGYKGVATTCSANCPAGFKDIGLFCQKPSGTYGRGVGYGWKIGDPVGNYDKARQRCVGANSQGCEKIGLIWYPKCKTGYKATTANICAPACPSGYADTGTGCRKPTYSRGVGKPLACPSGTQQGRKTERSGLLCYPTCKNKDYVGVGPVCWQKCPVQQPVGCGFGCSTDKGTCASVTSSQVISPIMAAVSIATLGSSAAATNAAKAAKAGKDVTKFTAGARKFTKLLKIINKLKRLKVMAKLTTMQAVGGPANMKKLIDAGKVLQIGYKFYVATSTLKDQHDLFKAEFSKQFAEQTSPEIAVEIERRFGPKGAEYIRQQWADKHLSMMVEADAWAASKNVLTVAAIADPTGLVSVVNAYLHPVCKESAVFPNIRLLRRD